MCFGWLQAPEFMPLCPCDLAFVLGPVHSQESERMVFCEKGIPSCGVWASSPGAQEDLWHLAQRPAHNRC